MQTFLLASKRKTEIAPKPWPEDGGAPVMKWVCGLKAGRSARAWLSTKVGVIGKSNLQHKHAVGVSRALVRAPGAPFVSGRGLQGIIHCSNMKKMVHKGTVHVKTADFKNCPCLCTSTTSLFRDDLLKLRAAQ